MPAAVAAVNQLSQYIIEDRIVISDGTKAGMEVKMTPQRAQIYRLVMSKILPDLQATTIERKTALQELPTEALIDKIAEMAKGRPELTAKLLEAIGGKVIQVEQEK